MKTIRRQLLAIAMGLGMLAGSAQAVDVQDITRDTQRMVINKDQVSMVWWIPQQFWVETFRDNKTLPEDVRTNLLNAMSSYTVLALLQARMSDSQLEEVQTREQLVGNTRFVIEGRELKALEREEIQEGVLLLLSLLRPALVQAAGSMGEGLEFVVYPAVVDGVPVIDAEQSGTLDITFFDRKFVWHLPLGSLLPRKLDTATGEIFPGNYIYNPYTGKKINED